MKSTQTKPCSVRRLKQICDLAERYNLIHLVLHDVELHKDVSVPAQAPASFQSPNIPADLDLEAALNQLGSDLK